MFDHPWVLLAVLVVGWVAAVVYIVRLLLGRLRRGSLDDSPDQRTDPGARFLAWRVGKNR